MGDSVKAKFTDTNTQVIDAYVVVRPEVIEALGKLAVCGATLESRANACRALGILRGAAADSAVGRGAALQGQPDNL